MMPWTLILIVMSYATNITEPPTSAGSQAIGMQYTVTMQAPHVATIPFATEELCNAAASKLTKDVRLGRPDAVCVRTFTP
jgi:hypothetical protein